MPDEIRGQERHRSQAAAQTWDRLRIIQKRMAFKTLW